MKIVKVTDKHCYIERGVKLVFLTLPELTMSHYIFIQARGRGSRSRYVGNQYFNQTFDSILKKEDYVQICETNVNIVIEFIKQKGGNIRSYLPEYKQKSIYTSPYNLIYVNKKKYIEKQISDMFSENFNFIFDEVKTKINGRVYSIPSIINVIVNNDKVKLIKRKISIKNIIDEKN